MSMSDNKVLIDIKSKYGNRKLATLKFGARSHDLLRLKILMNDYLLGAY